MRRWLTLRRAVRWVVAASIAVVTTAVLIWLGMPVVLSVVLGGAFGGVVTSEVVMK